MTKKISSDELTHPYFKRKFTEEHRKKLSETKKRLFSEGVLVSPNKGKHLSEETKRKLSVSHIKLYKEHPEISKRISEKLKVKYLSDGNPFYGKHHSEASKIKIGMEISKATKGKKFTEEHKEKLRNAMTERKEKFGYINSPDARKKISETNKLLYSNGIRVSFNKGKCFSEEIKRKMKQSHRNVSGKNNTFYGKCHSVKTKNEISKIRIATGCAKLSNNPAWLGGKSFEPYCPKFNNEFKNLVRLRDNFCCLNCGVSEQKSIILFKRKLATHHLDYDKKNTCLQNCCALCDSCHAKANKNRELWTEYYQDLLTKRYGYGYNYINKLNKAILS